MNTEKYTRPQLKKIYELLNHINTSNTNSLSHSKYDAVKCFKDAINKLYVSYYVHGHNHDGPVSEAKYYEIDRLGRQKDLKEEFSTALGVSEFFDKLTPCDITEELK